MFQRKPSNREKIVNNHYIIDYFHDQDRTPDHWKEDYHQFGSFDPGVANFGVRIERRYHTGTEKGKIIPILYEKLKLQNTEDKSQRILYSSLTKYLDNNFSKLEDCHIFVIERQMDFNYQSVRVQQHLTTYLMTKFKDSRLLPMLVEIDSKAKGHNLGSPKGIDTRTFKIWCQQKALELLKMRNDIESYEKLKAEKKKDDLADVVCQIEAFCVMFGMMLTPENPTMRNEALTEIGKDARKILNISLPTGYETTSSSSFVVPCSVVPSNNNPGNNSVKEKKQVKLKILN